MTFLIAEVCAGKLDRAERAALLAFSIVAFPTPDASPSQRIIGGQLMWL
jgi:hypothetical protein